MKQNKKQLKREYKQRPLAIGVFLIRNTVNDKVFLAGGQDLAGIINSHKFKLRDGIHPNELLQIDWQDLGADNFEFEILEQLDPPDNPQFDPKKELSLMEDMWLARLRPFAERGYNEPKLSREEKLRLIARRRLTRSDEP